MSELDELIHDWNVDPGAPATRGLHVVFDDETLRDGLQSPSARVPELGGKIDLLRRIDALGIRHADVGLPGAGPRAARDAEALCRAAVEERLAVTPNCAARTTESDVVPVLEIAQRTGRPVEIMLFLGTSPIRAYVEGWDLDELVERAARLVSFAVAREAPVTFVTEDTTRSRPEHLARIFQASVRAGARRVCVADTTGHATPLGAWAVVRFVREVLDEVGGEGVGIDWHGHNDRGLAVANALSAAYAGADRLHATALGVGERVGNTPMEQLLVNARLLGWSGHDLRGLDGYVSSACEMLGVEIPAGAPVVGRDAFRTSTGVHAAAILKALERGNGELADLVYSAVPAGWLGRRQVVDVGPMSGASNVRYWLRSHGYEADPELVERVFAAAKTAARILTDEELETIVCDADA